MATEQMEQSGFKRLEHPPYCPDLADVSSFFLAMHERMVEMKMLCRRGRVFISAF
jgi:transposase